MHENPMFQCLFYSVVKKLVFDCLRDERRSARDGINTIQL